MKEEPMRKKQEKKLSSERRKNGPAETGTLAQNKINLPRETNT